MKYKLLWPVALGLWSAVLADLPPHCEHDDVKGRWTLTLGQWAGGDRNCGYERPDKDGDRLGLRPPPGLSSSFQAAGQMELQLSDWGCHVVGVPEVSCFWTMVYDEGFHLQIEGGVGGPISFFSFFRYDRERRFALTATALSFCSQTLVGWVNPPLPQGSCFWGQKTHDEEGHPVQADKPTNRIPVERPLRKFRVLDVFRHDPMGNLRKVTAHREPIGDLSVFIQKQKVPFEVNNNPVIRDVKVTDLTQLNRLSGRFLYPLPEGATGRPRDVTTRPEGVGRQGFGSGPHRIPRPFHSQEPWESVRSFDWRNPDDVHWRLGVRRSMVPSMTITQGGCGSCYAITGSTVLTSRLWIHESEDETVRECQVPFTSLINCNVYTQACEGGYIFLAFKHGHDDGALPLSPVGESISHSDHTVGTCKAHEAKGHVEGACGGRQVQVARWNYVGNGYGLSNEPAMRKELLEHGPIGVSIEPTPEFGFYRQGVFRSVKNPSLADRRPFAWQQVDHALVLVGFGEEPPETAGGPPQPYWIVINSWGTSWGNHSIGHIARTVNDMGIENAAVFADPILLPPRPGL